MNDSYIGSLPGMLKGADNVPHNLIELLNLKGFCKPVDESLTRGYASPPLATIRIGDDSYDLVGLLGGLEAKLTRSDFPCDISGDICDITDAAPVPVPACVSAIEAAQAGTGDPSPENVRPISGWDAVNLTRTGRNLVSHQDYTFDFGNKATVIADDVIDVTTAASYDYGHIKVNVKAGVTYTAYWEFDYYGREEGDTNNTFYGYGFVEETETIQSSTGNVKANGVVKIVKTYTPAADGVWLFLAYPNYGNAASQGRSPASCRMRLMLVEGEYTLDIMPPFEPCARQMLTAALPETVYGGNLDWNSGVLTVTHALLTLTGSGFSQMESKPWQYVKQVTGLERGSASAKRAVCSHFRSTDSIWTTSAAGILTNTNCIHIGYPAAATVADFHAFLNAQAEAGTPVQVVYKIAAPYTIQLSPQQLHLLKGRNVVYSSTGDTSLTYIAEPKLYIDKAVSRLENAVLAMGANI